MKKPSFFILLLSLASAIYGQDLIIDKEGKTFHCTITKEDTVNVYFVTIWNNNQINTYINRDNIRSIMYNYVQAKSTDDSLKYLNHNYTRCVTFGVLNGGGSLLGMDVEISLSRSFGMQVGIGFVGFGAGINYHFKPTLRSSFLSFQYWHQGIMDSHTQSLIGPSVVFRARKIFTAQIGLGFALEKGPAWSKSMDQPPVMLTYSIGVYFPQ